MMKNQSGPNFNSVRSNQLQPINGRVVSGFEFGRFLKMSVNEKVLWLREEMSKMYGKREYSVSRVAKRASISPQGLINVEKKNTNPYKGTLELLAKEYGLPLTLLIDGENSEKLDGFFLGKAKDKKDYFDAYFQTYNEYHFLDKRYMHNFSQSEDEYEDVRIDDDGFDVIRNPDGSCSLDRYTVEVSIKLYQTSSGFYVGEEQVQEERVVISPSDLKHLKELMKLELNHMALRYEQSQPSRSDVIREYQKKLSIRKNGLFEDGAGI